VFARGEGQDIIYDNGYTGELDTLQLGPDITTADVIVTQTADGRDLVLSIDGAADSILLRYQLSYAYGGIDQVQFSDGTIWTRADLMEHATMPTAGNDVFYGDYGDNALGGGAGNDTLGAGSGNDTLTGGAGDDSLAGGSGNDLYVFDLGSGVDIITDFKAGAGTDDVIQFSTDLFADFAAVQAASLQSGSSVVITAVTGEAITLRNVPLASLHADDFRFV
jgi:Ca2+-binding RTX toxin-like protein